MIRKKWIGKRARAERFDVEGIIEDVYLTADGKLYAVLKPDHRESAYNIPVDFLSLKKGPREEDAAI